MVIEYFKVTSSDPVATHLTSVIKKHLQNGEKVLWILSGGSSIKIAIDTANKLNIAKIDSIGNLSISLADERYGQNGHLDSNWQQLLNAGLKIPGANLFPVLTGGDLGRTSRNFDNFIKNALAKNNFRIALVGIGADGHTLGIKPRSPAVNSVLHACSYEWDDYTRLTLTPVAIAKIDEIVAYAVGNEKHKALDDIDRNISNDDLPANFLKSVRKLTVYNDYKGVPL